jgi:hypothetical protein
MNRKTLIKDALVICPHQAPVLGWVSVRDDRIAGVGTGVPRVIADSSATVAKYQLF